MVYNSFIKYLLLLFFALLINLKCYSQVDSNYIRQFPQNFSLKIYLQNESTSLLDTYLLEETTYSPNKPLGIGLGVSWGKIGLSFSYGFNFLKDNKRGNTKSLDLQYHYYGKKFIFDFFYQKYQGFYIDDLDNNEIFEIRKNLKIFQLGIFSQYVFNSKRFSYSATFDQSERQIKSAGSFLLGGGIYYNQIHSDGIFVFNNSINDNEKQINFQFGPSAGYAYTWVISKNYFISLSLSVGFSIGFNNNEKGAIFSPTAFPRFATGYNGKTWSINLSYVSNLIYTSFTEDRKIALSTDSFLLTFIKRFHLNSNLPEKLPFLNILN